MWDKYKECIRIMCHDFLPKRKKFEYKNNLEYQIFQGDTKGINFDPLTIEDIPFDILRNMMVSIRNIRKNILTEGATKRVLLVANSMKRTSFLGELEIKYIIALNGPMY
jgi:hypothetical protein